MARADVAAALTAVTHKLPKLLDSPSPPTIAAMGALLAEIARPFCDPGATVEREGESLARVLAMALTPSNIMYHKVREAVGGALRAMLLVGGDAKGKGIAQLYLQRGGGGEVLQQLVEVAESLDAVGGVSLRVHGRWYTAICNRVNGAG